MANRRSAHRGHGLAVTLGVVLAASCGGGTATLLDDGGGSGDQAATTVSDVTVSAPKTSPSTVSFRLRGVAATSASVRFRAVDGIAGPVAELQGLQASKGGTLHTLDWDFAAALGEARHEGLLIEVELPNGSRANSGPIVVGNDAPEILELAAPDPATESVGIVPLTVRVADDDELVDVHVEVDVGAGWSAALSGGAAPGSLPADPSLPDVFATSGGVERVFFWDVVQQFGPLDSEVSVRVTATDHDDDGSPLHSTTSRTALFAVDNNQPPTVDLDEGAFLLGPDRRRGLAIPFSVRDAEGDSLGVVFQWTVAEQPFPELPADDAALEAVLADPDLRSLHRIASPYRSAPTGRVLRAEGDTVVVLPELAAEAAAQVRSAAAPGGDVTRALNGYQLELLRRSRVPSPVRSTWQQPDLQRPAGVLPAARLTTAYVLDADGAAGWRLRELDLATGATVAELAVGPGRPDVLAADRGSGCLLVASVDAALWRIHRVDLAQGTDELLAEVATTGPDPAIGGLVAVGSDRLLVATDDGLLALELEGPLPLTQAVPLRGGLSAPSGLALDRGRGHLYVADPEAPGGGAVLRLMPGGQETGVVLGSEVGIQRPTAVTIDRSLDRLLILCDADPGDGQQEVVALDLNEPGSHVRLTGLPEAASLACGADGLTIMALRTADDLAVGGGVQQSRRVVHYDPALRAVVLDPPCEPAPEPGQPWRLLLDRLDTGPGQDREALFTWDSRDVPGHYGEVRLRATVRDQDRAADEHDGAKKLVLEPDVTIGELGLSVTSCLATGDLDADGDTDVAATEDGALLLFHQEETGAFGAVPTGLRLGFYAKGVAVGDLDSNGLMDLAVVDWLDGRLALVHQLAPGVFTDRPTFLDTGQLTDLAIADLDRDGRDDLVLVGLQNSLSLWRQSPAGLFYGPWQEFSASTTGAELVVRDLDRDGDLDIVLAGFFAIEVFLQVTVGFSPDTQVLGQTGYSDEVAIGDMDADGDLDIIRVPYTAPRQLAIHLQDEPGDFRTTAELIDVPQLNSVSGLIAVDLDEDGDDDLVTATADGLAVLLQTAPATFADELVHVGSSAGSRLCQADLDGDGRLDLLMRGASSWSAYLARPSAFGAPDTIHVSGGQPLQPGQELRDVAVADLNGDGQEDLAVLAQDGTGAPPGARLQLFYQLEHGQFADQPETRSAFLPSGVTAVELNGDGHTDLVVRDYQSVTVRLQQSGGFPKAWDHHFAVEAFPMDLETGDVTGDGLADLVTANWTSGLSVLRYLGTTWFAFPTFIGSPHLQECFDVALGDLDLDGDLDVVAADADAEDLVLFLQTDPGVLDQQVARVGGSLSSGPGVDMTLADLDGNGRLDVLLPLESEHYLALFLQDAAGQFPTSPLALGGPGITDGVTAAAVGDVDADGDLDIVTANALQDDLRVFVQTLPATYRAGQVLIGAPFVVNEPQTVALRDLDGDGDPDLVSSNATSNVLTWMNHHGQ